MARRTIYFSEEQDWLYGRVKELAEQAGESVGAVAVRAFEEYISRQQDEEPVTLFVGEKIVGFADCGEFVKFYGVLIGKGNFETGTDSKHHQMLFRTKKGKLLLYEVDEDPNGSFAKYQIFERVSELRDKHLALEILDGLKNQEIGCRFIDV